MTATNFQKSKSKIIIVGAGPVGLYCAMLLAAAGYKVSVIDNGRRGAGWASGGMLGAAYEILCDPEAPESIKIFARESQWLWTRFLGALDVPLVPGSVFVAQNNAEVVRFAQAEKALADFGVDLTPVDVPPQIMGQKAWSCAADIAFDPRQMLTVLAQHCVAHGASFVCGTAVGVKKGQVTLSDGSFLHGDHIIVATGQGGSALAQYLPELEFIGLVKGQMLAVAGSGVAIDQAIRAGRSYLLARGELVVVGATSTLMQEPNLDLDTTLHQRLWHDAVKVCPSLSGGTVVESWSGLRPTTPDALPLVGHSKIEGVILATGTYRNGWLMAAAIGHAVLGLVEGDTTAQDKLQPFAPNRFSIGH